MLPFRVELFLVGTGRPVFSPFGSFPYFAARNRDVRLIPESGNH